MDMDAQTRELANIIRGGIRVAGRRICADEECDGKHPGWEDCVMFRRWVEMAEKKLKEFGLDKCKHYVTLDSSTNSFSDNGNKEVDDDKGDYTQYECPHCGERFWVEWPQ
jgi:hypothetical protein